MKRERDVEREEEVEVIIMVIVYHVGNLSKVFHT